MADDNLYIYKGDNKTHKMNVKDKDGNVLNIAGWSFIFTIKKYLTNVANIVQKDSATPSEITITDEANGVIEVYMVPADTSGEEVGEYVYDVEATEDTGEKRTLAVGRYTINEVVT